jgi:NADPH:quinone reductase-like Zn-dependent oxidoreductase
MEKRAIDPMRRCTVMRAAWYERQGPASDGLVLAETATPLPGAGEVRIRVIASGINPGDVKKCQEIDPPQRW